MEPLDNSHLKVTFHGYLQTIQRLIHFATESYYLGNDATPFHGSVLIFVWSYLVLIVFVRAYLYIRRERTDGVQFERLLCCLPATRTKYSVMYMFEDYTQWKRVYWIRVTIPTWHDLVLEQIDDFSRLYWFMVPYNFVAFFPLAAEKHYKMSSEVMYYWTILFVAARGSWKWILE